MMSAPIHMTSLTKSKLGQIGVGSNIAQNKLELVWTLLKIK